MRFWIGLSIAIICEVIGVTFLNYSEGFSKLLPTMIAITFYLSSIIVYMWNTKEKEVGVVGALFAGIGTVVVLVVGFLLFNESISSWRLLGVSLIILGSVRLCVIPTQEGVYE